MHWEENGWLEPGERMDAEALGWVLAEKDYGVRKAEESLRHVEAARPHLREADARDLHDYFARTLLTARLHRAVSAAYFGYRVWARGGALRTPEVAKTVRDGLAEIEVVAQAIEEYPTKPPAGQWTWVEDAGRARQYHRWITGGWPAVTRGYRNPYGGLAFVDR